MRSLSALPNIRIVLDGLMVGKKDMGHLSRLRVVQKLSHPSLCEVVFSLQDHGMIDRHPFRAQSVFSVFVGDERLPLFHGIITAVEYRYGASGGLGLHVRGYDALYFSAKKQRIHTYLDATVPEMAAEMTKASGIGIRALENGPVWRQLLQFRETDLDFLARTAQRSGLYFFLTPENILDIMTLSGNGDTVFLSRGDDLFELTVETNDAASLSSVYTSGWDPFLAEFHDGSASSDNGEGQQRKLVDIPLRNSLEAEAVSKAELDRSGAHALSARGVAGGNRRLMPGVTVLVDGIHPLLKKKFLISEVAHTITHDTGYVSSFSSLPPDFRTADTGTNATFGRVIDVDDPENRGRIKAVLPAMEHAQTEWMNVVLPAAGNNKGAVMLPDVDDQVLILFLNNDPARGVVMGGVFGASQQPEHWGVSDSAVKRYCFVTPEGQKITLNDTRRGIRVENREGSYLELYPDAVTLHAATDLVIRAPEKNITVLGRNIDFQKG